MDFDAQLKAIRDAGQRISQTTQQGVAEREKGIADIKQQYDLAGRQQSLQGLKKAAYDTENMLTRLPKDVQNRTRGRLVTNSQLNRITANEQSPLAQQLADISRSADSDQNSINMIRGLISDFTGENTNKYNALTAALTGERDLAANEYAARWDKYKFDNQAKMEADRLALSRQQAQWQREQAAMNLDALRQQVASQNESRDRNRKEIEDLLSRNRSLIDQLNSANSRWKTNNTYTAPAPIANSPFASSARDSLLARTLARSSLPSISTADPNRLGFFNNLIRR